MTPNDLLSEELKNALTARADHEVGSPEMPEMFLPAVRRDVSRQRVRRVAAAGVGLAAAAALVVALLPNAVNFAQTVEPTGTSGTQSPTSTVDPHRAMIDDPVTALPVGPAPSLQAPLAVAPWPSSQRPFVLLRDGTRVQLDPARPLVGLLTDSHGSIGYSNPERIPTGGPMPNPYARLTDVQIFALDPGATSPRILATGAFMTPVLSPDGTQVAVVRLPEKPTQLQHVVILDRATGREVRSFEFGYPFGELYGWAPSGIVGRRVLKPEELPTEKDELFISEGGELQVLSPTGARLQVLSPTGARLRALPPTQHGAIPSSGAISVSASLDRAVYEIDLNQGDAATIDLATGKEVVRKLVIGAGTGLMSREGNRYVAGNRVYDVKALEKVTELPLEVNGTRATFVDVWDTGLVGYLPNFDERPTWFSCDWSGKPECHRLPEDFASAS